MKNDKSKSMQVILLVNGEPDESLPGIWTERFSGPAGFQVKGLYRMLFWSDEGKTWKRVEDSQ